MVDAADGFIAVTPEYNYGMPAVLKNALDYLGSEWAWKPIGFVSYGNTSAGTRSVQHAKQVVTTLCLVPLGATVALRIGDAITDGQVRRDPALAGAAAALLDELVRVAHALRPVRDRSRANATTGPLPGSYARPLTADDTAEVTVLQRCCWVDEAFANDTLDVPALHEAPEDVRAWLRIWHATGLWLDGRLLGMVRPAVSAPTGTWGGCASCPTCAARAWAGGCCAPLRPPPNRTAIASCCPPALAARGTSGSTNARGSSQRPSPVQTAVSASPRASPHAGPTRPDPRVFLAARRHHGVALPSAGSANLRIVNTLIRQMKSNGTLTHLDKECLVPEFGQDPNAIPYLQP